MVPHDHLTGIESGYLRYPLQREMEINPHQNNVTGYYNSYPMPEEAIYGSSVVQQPHAPSSGRPGLLEGNVPISSYYSFAGAARIIR